MTAETILTDEQVRNNIEDVAWPNEEVFKFTVEVARAIEQAVLQSEQVQAWKRDAGRYKWLKDQFRILSLDMGGKHSWTLQRPIRGGSTIDGVCDAAMEKQP